MKKTLYGALFPARFALICIKKIFSKSIGQLISQIKILYIRSTHKTHEVPHILAWHIKTVPDLHSSLMHRSRFGSEVALLTAHGERMFRANCGSQNKIYRSAKTPAGRQGDLPEDLR